MIKTSTQIFLSCSSCARPNYTIFKKCLTCRERKNRLYRKHAEKIKANARLYHIDNRNNLNLQKAKKRYRLKLQILNHYTNGEMKCTLCPESRLWALTMDHIERSGRQHIKSLVCGRLYDWLIKNNYPAEYRCLCSNCNHKQYVSRSGKPSTKPKLMVMERLGNRCVICGYDDIDVLTVHHIMTNGAEHRKILGSPCSTQFYRILLKLDDFQGLECRCFSCNDEEYYRELCETRFAE